MTNSYTILGNETYIEIGKGKLLCLIDTEDLETVRAVSRGWKAVWSRSAKTYYAMALSPETSLPGQRCRNVYMHRLILSAPTDLDVDHILHNGLDNRKKNLQLKTRSQNLLNRQGAQSNSSTGMLGVSYVEGSQRGKGHGRDRSGYIAQIRVNGKKYRCSVRSTAEEASAWYWAKRRELGIPDPETRAV